MITTTHTLTHTYSISRKTVRTDKERQMTKKKQEKKSTGKKVGYGLYMEEHKDKRNNGAFRITEANI